MAKRRKRKKSSKLNSKNISERLFVSCSFLIMLLLLICGVSYYLFGSNGLKLNIKNTTNYISFNDLFDSDTIKINNLKKLNERKGKKSKVIDLNIKGVNDNLEYEVLLVPINVNIDYKFINYYLTDEDNNDIIYDNLSNTSLSNDYSGHVIYSGVLNNKSSNLKLRVWIDEDYNGDIDNNSFEVKIKLK